MHFVICAGITLISASVSQLKHWGGNFTRNQSHSLISFQGNPFRKRTQFNQVEKRWGNSNIRCKKKQSKNRLGQKERFVCTGSPFQKGGKEEQSSFLLQLS